MRELMNIIRSRRSTRAFQPGKLPPREQIEQLVEAAQWAPQRYGQAALAFYGIYIMQTNPWNWPVRLAQRPTVVRTIIFTMPRCKSLFPMSATSGTRYSGWLGSYGKHPAHGRKSGTWALAGSTRSAIAATNRRLRKLLTSYGIPSSHIVIASAAIGYIAKETPAKSRKEGTVTFVE